ncbi:MAG TPA: hypothetical protein EYP14_09845 [Planctomycetaceae bacterium]|nr:hypothetical protein [Planctomycetaceae bacterium]
MTGSVVYSFMDEARNGNPGMRRTMRELGWILLLALVFGPRHVWGTNTALIELTVGDQSFQGRVLARSRSRCWLLGRDGQIHEIPLASVTSYRQVSASFRSFSAAQVRSRLLQEFGRELEVAGTRHYLVAAPRGRARRYAEVLERAYRNYYLYFRTRGFEFRDPEFPLVALVFPDRADFAEYCRRDRVPIADGLRGYYLRTSNRIALYDPAGARTRR